MSNKQPFYNSVTLLFTTKGRAPYQAEVEECAKAFGQSMRIRAPLAGGVDVEEFESDAGDPADLVE